MINGIDGMNEIDGMGQPLCYPVHPVHPVHPLIRVPA